MTERDAFEIRFHAAVRGYVGRVSSDLDPVELAHRIAASEPRRHGFGAVLGWRTSVVPRSAWVLLLLVALLAAMVAGMLLAGSQPAPRLPALVPPVPAVVPPVGPAFACPLGSTPDEPGPVDQARPPRDVPTAMAFDRRAGRLVMLAGVDDAVETWTFDVCTNAWMQMNPELEPFGWLQLVYDPGSDRTMGVADCRDCVLEPTGTAWAYDLEANTWNQTGPAPTGVRGLFHDTDAGLVIAARYNGNPEEPALELWSYERETEGWTAIHGANGLDRAGLFAYDVSVDRIIGYGPILDHQNTGPETWLFESRTSRWSRSGTETPGVYGSGMWGAPPAIAYDEAAQQTAVFGDRLAAYDATADGWTVLIDDQARNPDDWLPSAMVYDSVNRRLIGMGRGVVVNQGGVVAFDLVDRKWTVLLEPSGGQAAPSTN